MTDFRQLSERFFVSAQLGPDDFEAARDAGIACIVNNRPDGEDPASPQDAEARNLAAGLGLGYRHIPITPGSIAPDEVEALREVIAATDGPVLAYCRSGMRSSVLWGMASVGDITVDEIVARAAMAGYDLSGVKPLMEMIAKQGQ